MNQTLIKLSLDTVLNASLSVSSFLFFVFLKILILLELILALSVSHNALVTDKTKAKFAQREALNICSAYRWFRFLCVLALPSVYLSTVQCYYKSFGS